YEGQALNHCVGDYIGKVAAGETIILFVRRLSKPNKPYVTIEVDPIDKKLGQISAMGNATPKMEVLDFLDRFKKKVGIA
ncbi:MAG: PcfJ domain-containing protein, partial [Lachnospiraceae bacterium]|nr:PcfJ domain-containing protein [Lachnospiraceae bacterium]